MHAAAKIDRLRRHPYPQPRPRRDQARPPRTAASTRDNVAVSTPFATRMLASPSTISIAPAAGRRSARASDCGPAATTFTGAKVTAEEIGADFGLLLVHAARRHLTAPCRQHIRIDAVSRRDFRHFCAGRPNSQPRSPLCGLRTTVACERQSEAHLHRRRQAGRRLSPCHPSPHPPSISNGRHHLNTRAKFVGDAPATVTLYSSSEQNPITCSTPARLYQLRSNSTISPRAGSTAA